MFVGRTAEIKLLEKQYAEAASNLVILYGRKGIGKTTLLSEFLKEKPSVIYYEGMECAGKLQLHYMNQRIFGDDRALSYTALFSEFINMQQGKTIIALDEFHHILRNSPEFVEVFRLLSNQEEQVMFVLLSSSVRFVENEMIESLGAMASYITAYSKLKEFTFVDLVTRFPKSSVETCININAILGGIPEYLEEWDEKESTPNNIIHRLLNKNSRLFSGPLQFLKLELRETAVYSTILSAMAEGNLKLNDLYAKTGYSRAKILVYLKNLSELDIIEKLVPLSEEGRENVQKGLYRIKDNFFHFWYRFLFPNLSDLMLEKPQFVFENKIAPFLSKYMGEYFADVCTEFLKLMNQHRKLPEKFLWWDRWYGKNGTIDILSRSASGKYLVAKCLWEDRRADIQDYEALVSLAEDAEKTPDFCYLFSKEGFQEELYSKADSDKNLILVGLDDL